MRLLIHALAIQCCLMTVAIPAASGAATSTVQPDDEDTRRWLDRLSDEDRSAIGTGIGFAVPELPSSIEWVGKAPFKVPSDVAGRVLVVQTWTCGTSQGRAAPRRVAKALKNAEGAEDVVVVLLHTPQDMDRAKTYCSKNRQPYPVVLDADGSACDRFGAYKRPVNFVIDRSGEMRYAGLNDRGLRAAVEKVAAEPYEESDKPKNRPEPKSPKADSSAPAEYPPITGSVGSARDLRGQSAPPFAVDRWISPEPNARGKVAIVDFWATWCGPCVASIPHMNGLASEFRGQVECVGISDERINDFEKGLDRANLDGTSFAYSLALDSRGRMKKAFQIKGIPHVVVISSDWIVRWQGHPSRLTSAIVQQIVDADPGAQVGGDTGGTPGVPPSRWAGSERSR